MPFITTLHGTDITLVGMDPSYFPITKFSIEQSDGVTAISQDLRRHTVDVFGVQNEIRVIHNFVNCNTYAPDPEQRYRILRPRGKAADHLSNFRPVKRVLDCIRVLAEVREACGRASVYGGRWAGTRSGGASGRRLGVEPHVEFLGKQNGVERLIRLAHVLLMPSEMESFGLAALERWRAACPGGDAGGWRAGTIDDGEDGFLETVGDMEGQAGRWWSC